MKYKAIARLDSDYACALLACREHDECFKKLVELAMPLVESMNKGNLDHTHDCVPYVMRAIDKYDKSKGISLASYIYMWVKSWRGEQWTKNNRPKRGSQYQHISYETVDWLFSVYTEPQVRAVSMREAKHIATAVLDEDEYKLLMQRYDGVKLADIGESLGITCEAVRQRIVKIEAKLRRYVS